GGAQARAGRGGLAGGGVGGLQAAHHAASVVAVAGHGVRRRQVLLRGAHRGEGGTQGRHRERGERLGGLAGLGDDGALLLVLLGARVRGGTQRDRALAVAGSVGGGGP